MPTTLIQHNLLRTTHFTLTHTNAYTHTYSALRMCMPGLTHTLKGYWKSDSAEGCSIKRIDHISRMDAEKAHLLEVQIGDFAIEDRNDFFSPFFRVIEKAECCLPL